MSSSEEFVQKCLAEEGDEYEMGWGDENVGKKSSETSQWDCSGLVYAKLHELGITNCPRSSTQQLEWCRSSGTLISLDDAVATRGALLMRKGHVAVSLGNGQTIEAMGEEYGVLITSATKGRTFTDGGLVPGLKYLGLDDGLDQTPNYDGDRIAVNESKLTTLVKKFEDFSYDLDDTRYPYKIPGVSLKQSPPKTINCCTFIEAMLVKAWADTHSDFEWNLGRHNQMMISSSNDYFSPVTVAVESQMAIEVSAGSNPRPWTIIQGWRRQWNSGHTFIVVHHHKETDRVLTLEANSSYRIDGVGFRSIGNIKQFACKPPANWWEREDLWTWEKIKLTYKYLKQAQLKVKNLSWSGIDHRSSSSEEKRVSDSYMGMIQDKLKELGYYAGAVTGAVNKATTKAIESFQAATGLTADGVVGDRTRVALQHASAITASSQSTSSSPSRRKVGGARRSRPKSVTTGKSGAGNAKKTGTLKKSKSKTLTKPKKSTSGTTLKKQTAKKPKKKTPGKKSAKHK